MSVCKVCYVWLCPRIFPRGMTRCFPRRRNMLTCILMTIMFLLLTLIYIQKPRIPVSWAEKESRILSALTSGGKLENTDSCKDMNANRSRLYTELGGAPMVSGHPPQLVILGYQRVGSSFFGQLFDQNPDAFYIYEPLDAVYTAMFGTAEGFNVPSDVTAFRNGSERRPSGDENEASRAFLESLLRCDVDRLPTEFFVHKFWTYLPDFILSWKPYGTCLKVNNVAYGRLPCYEHLQGLCPPRFGSDPEQQAQCQLGIAAAAAQAPAGRKGPFERYASCMAEVRRQVAPCIHILKSKCQRSSMAVTKTVRATADMVRPLLEANPNTRVIHLIRDPRAVAASRMKGSSGTFRGLFTGVVRPNIVREAFLYCRRVLRDVQSLEALRSLHPGSVARVIYEDFARFPVEYAGAVYRDFLKRDVPDSLAGWVSGRTQGDKWQNSAVHRMTSWKAKLSPSVQCGIKAVCEEFYRTVPYPWDATIT